MTTMLSARPVTSKPPPPPKKPRPQGALNRRHHEDWMEASWRHRYQMYLEGQPVVEPAQVVLTADEAAWLLRLDVICEGSRARGLRALSRLGERRELRPIVFAGDGGGVGLYRRADVLEFLAREET